MTVSDWMIVVATILGPILAVQAQKWVERATESRRRRRWIFDTIMSNRATRLADENIKALNAIDLEFRRRRIPSRRDRAVVEAWHSLFGELSQGVRVAGGTPDAIARWNERCADRYVDLENAMAKALGFRFSDEELRRGIYYPQAHGERELAQLVILNGLKRLFAGETALNMNVKEMPVTPEAAAAQTALLQKLANAYTDEGAVKVLVVNEEPRRAIPVPEEKRP